MSPPPLLVMPEGTTTTTTPTHTLTSPFSSTASLVPLSTTTHSPPSHTHRLPKAKCFILPSVPPATPMYTHHNSPSPLLPLLDDTLHGSFVSDGLERPVIPVPHIVRLIDAHPIHSDDASSDSSFMSCDDPAHPRIPALRKPGPRVYDFDDDFPSIGASESTHPRSRGVRAGDDILKDREGSAIVQSWEDVEFGRGASVSFGNGSRVSFASSLRRRVSWCQTREEKMRMRMKKGGVEDSVVRDFREARMRNSAVRDHPVSSEATANARGKGAAAEGKSAARMTWGGGKWGLTAWWTRVWKKRDEDEERREEQERHYGKASSAESMEGANAGVVMDERKMEDMQFISMLAYDDFMHSPNRPSPMAKMFSRLRRG